MPRRQVLACLAGLAGLAGTLFPAVAAAELKVRWDCYLPDASVDCVILQGSLTSKIPFLTMVPDAKEADVVVTLSSIPAENATRFDIHLVGKRVEGSATEVRATDKIPSSIDSTTATVRILTKLQRGLANFMDQKVAAEVKEGQLDIQVLDPVHLPFTGRPEQNGVKWYVAPAVGTYFSDVEGVGINASGNASLSFNYSERTWRLEQWIGANYSQQSQPVPGTSETASIRFAGGNANNVLSWSVTADNRWNLGLLLAAEKNPQANYRMRANGSVGLEYDLVPRQTVNQRNFGFRCALGPEFQRYDSANVQGKDQQLLARQFCDVFLSWHFEAVDVGANIGETSHPRRHHLPSFLGERLGYMAGDRQFHGLAVGERAADQRGHRRGPTDQRRLHRPEAGDRSQHARRGPAGVHGSLRHPVGPDDSLPVRQRVPRLRGPAVEEHVEPAMSREGVTDACWRAKRCPPNDPQRPR